MPLPKLMGKRTSLNLEQLRKEEWGQNSMDHFSFTPRLRIKEEQSLNGDTAMVSTKPPERQTVDWGDEKEDGAIYHVVLRKVRYHTTNKVPYSYDEFVSYLEWETQKKRTLKAGTLEKLIEQLLPENEIIDEVDPGYLIAFLTMYHTFASADNVISGMFERIRNVKKKNGKSSKVFENVLRSTVKVILVWIDHFPNDFNEENAPEVLKKVQSFATTELKDNLRKEILRKIQQLSDKLVITPYDIVGHSPSSSFTESSLSDGSTFYSETTEFLDFEPSEVAEQLTLIDAKLFKAVIPRHCVGCIWSRRDKNDNTSLKAATVRATVNQFNAVIHRVISTILIHGEVGSPNVMTRAKRVENWIEIAQECRELKNFSSLKAIVSALQSVSIHRLKKTWSNISRYHSLLFEELSKLVSEDSNQQTGREVLKREGTAKTFEPSKRKTSSLTRSSSSRKSNRIPMNGINGTVPYLGTFLTDLMMLDAAYADIVDENLINFEKRQKEFEIIAQIKLFQQAAKNYHILPNEKFRLWFDALETFTENESFTLSCTLETHSIPKRQSSLFRSRKMKSENDLSSLSKSQEDGPPSYPQTPGVHRRQNSNSSSVSEGSTNCCGTGHIIRVTIENSYSCSLYKSIWVSEGVRTDVVIKTCLLKHNFDDELPEHYDLIQVLSRAEITIPKNENVYYAINTKTQPFTFILRKRKNNQTF